jgi:hypothetical protein
VIVGKGASIVGQIQAAVATCTSNPDVQAAMRSLGQAMGGG